MKQQKALETDAVQSKLAYSLEDLQKVTPMSIAFYRKEIREKRLRAKLVGSRVVVMAENLDQYLKSRPDWHPGLEPEYATAARQKIRLTQPQDVA